MESVTPFKIKGLNYPIVKIPILGTENSCYFHAILRGYYKCYISEKTVEGRTKIARFFRNVLADELESIDEKGKKVYDKLSRGSLKEYAASLTSDIAWRYTKEGMKELLRSKQPVDHSFQELICDSLDIDIYLIDEKSGDHYYTSEDEIYFRGRESLLLSYSPGHYSLLGLKKGKEVQTLFDPDDEIIKILRERINGEKSH